MSSLLNYFERSWRNIYFVPLILGITLAFFDNIGRRMFLQVSESGEVYQAMEPLYMDLFHGMVFMAVAATAAVMYYYRKDFREVLAYTVFSLATIYSGLWDILYYRIQGKMVPNVLEHLAGSPMSLAAALLNNGVVTREMLYLNTGLFLVGGVAVAGFIRFYDF